MKQKDYRVLGTRTVCGAPPGELLTTADIETAGANLSALLAAGALEPVDEHQADNDPGQDAGGPAPTRRRRAGGES
jgi:hypothetical protein